jgi:hypothetical protein
MSLALVMADCQIGPFPPAKLACPRVRLSLLREEIAHGISALA